MLFFAAIYVPDFAAAAILRAEPELRQQPLAILEGTPPLLRVMGMNEAARVAGIEIGMAKLQAEALPGLMLRHRLPAQEETAHAALLDCAHAFSPRVEPLAPDTLLVDITGLERLFGSPTSIAHQLSARASELGLETHVAVAANREAAVHAARGFAGITVIAAGEEAQRLGPLPVDVLFGTPAGFAAQKSPSSSNSNKDSAQQFLETLDRWGVHSLSALASLPTVAVAERLGQEGVRLQKLARGIGSQSMTAAEPPLKFEEAIELEYPLDLLEPLAFILSRLLEQICARLSSRALATNELRLTMDLDRAVEEQITQSSNSSVPPPLRGEFTRALRLPVPMCDAKLFLKLLQLDLKAYPPNAPVTRVAIAAAPVRPQVAQHGLFMPVTPEPEKLQLMLARIAGVVGEANLGSPQVLDTHRPTAFAMRQFEPPTSAAERSSGRRPAGRASERSFPENPSANEINSSADKAPPPMALRIFRPPLPAKVEVRDERLIRLLFAADTAAPARSIAFDVLWAAGPWRTSGAWWEPKHVNHQKPETKNSMWSRDEWDIAVIAAANPNKHFLSSNGRNGKPANAFVLYRLVHDLTTGKWFVEGSYD